MALIELVLNLTPHPALSMLIAVVLLVLVLFLARTFFYQMVRSFTRMLRSVLRLTARSILEMETRLSERNRNVLTAKNLEYAERIVRRDTVQFQAAVTSYFRNYTVLHQRISEMLANIEADHHRSMDVPPSLPNWLPILEAVAQIKPSNDAPVGALLGSIDQTLQEQHRRTLAEYTRSIKNRHAILARLVPLCSRLNEMMDRVDRSLKALEDRAERLDASIRNYAQIRTEDHPATRLTSLSSLMQLFAAGLVLLVAACGVVVNFHLMELPMSEVFGGGSYLGPFKISQVAAAVITAIELTLGMFLVEALWVTRLFPIIGALEDRIRRRLVWIALVFLIVFAGLEAAMGLLRVQMVADIAQLHQMLSGVETTDALSSHIPAIGQMILGFVLPFWIACAAVPLAAFAMAARTAAGFLAAVGLRLLAFGLRLGGNVAVHTGRMVIAIYDLAIFPILLLNATFDSDGEAAQRPGGGSLMQYSFSSFWKRRQHNQCSEGSQ
ncbi:MAG TPA: hypothetical protein ACFCUC_10860 [Desulfobacterales bacterium]